ncbi:CBO0543 family protein [Gracilibacillus sp. D59]|uniref:CBO0543 family protein n=1 Tax=Gracilibacillus sp. D59 TaxID=3457434 RepID=UPI003FCEE463
MNNFEKELINLQNEYASFIFDNWINYGLFTWSWWFLALGIFIPWLIFIKYFDRNRALPIWCVGFIVIIITSFFDDLGSELGIWIYPVKFVPVGLIAYPFDFSIIPVGYMLIYQFCNTWKSFGIALVSLAAFFAFIGEPVSVWIGTVKYLKWNYIYSFIFYIVTGVIAKAFIQKVSP